MAYKLLDDEETEVSPKKGRYRLLEEEPVSQDYLPQITRGIAEGGLDIASLPALAMYPIERGSQKLFGVEDKPGQLLPGQETRYSAQHEILTKMQDPNYKPSFSDFMMLSDDDDLVPQFGGSTSLTAVQELQKQIPQGGATQEIVRRGTRNLPFLLGGPAAYSAATGSDLTGYGASKTVEEMGGGEGAQLTADILGSLLYGGRSALNASRSKVPAVAEQTGGLLSRAEMKGSQSALQKGIQELDSTMIKNFDDKTAQLSRNTFSDFPSFEAQEINRDIVRTNQNAVLNRIAPEMTAENAWSQVANQVEEAFQKERETYSNLYSEARKRAKGIKFDPTESRNLAANLLKTIRNVETTAPGYEAVGKALNTALTDLGVSIENVGGKAAVKTQPVTVDKMMDVAIRLGEIINYENLTPSIKDLLKPLVKNLKGDIRQGLRSQSPLGFLAFDKAEKAFGQAADKFGNDAIMKLRKSETPENLTSFFSSPSNYNRLKAVGSESSISMADRQIIEELSAKNTESARKELRNLEQYFSQANKQIANSLIDMGDKLTAPGQKAVLQQRILEDAQRAVTNGERPNITMKAMQTPEGYNIVKQTLERTPKGKEIFKVMQKQFAKDLFQSILDDSGKINWSKAANLIKDPQVKATLRSIGGEDLVNFFRSLETYGTNIKNNFAKYGSENGSLFSEVSKIAKSPTKILLKTLTGYALGPLPYVGLEVGKFLATQTFYRALANPKVQGIIKALSKPETYNKGALLPLIHRLNSLLPEDE